MNNNIALYNINNKIALFSIVEHCSEKNKTKNVPKNETEMQKFELVLQNIILNYRTLY